MLTRPAGPQAAVSGQLRLGDFNEEDQTRIATLPKRATVALWIDGQQVGAMPLDKDLPSVDLPASQVRAPVSYTQLDV